MDDEAVILFVLHKKGWFDLICIPLMILLSLINNIFLNNIQLLLKLNYFWNFGEALRNIAELETQQPFRQPGSGTDECADKYADLGG